MREGKGKPIIRPACSVLTLRFPQRGRCAFCQSSGVSCRYYSIPLQRIITDFGTDVPFGRIPQKLREHYGITVPITSAQKITLLHAATILQKHKPQTQIPTDSGVEQLIVEIDGSMIPIVETESNTDQEAKIDRRKTRTVSWREARLCLAREQDSSQPTFGATLGSVDAAGEQLADTAIKSRTRP